MSAHATALPARRVDAALLAFWGASLSVGLAAFVVVAALAHTGRPGELAAASAVLGVSFVLAVVPGAIQLHATATASRPGEAPGLPVGLLAWTTALLALLAVPAALALAVPPAALLVLAGQYAAAGVASAQRGAFIGRREHARASRSMAIEAGARLVAGLPLVATLGATGLALALLLGSAAAAFDGRAAAGPLGATGAREPLAASVSVGALMVLVNLDAFLAPRILDSAADADAYAAAALPARGLFFALFALSWLAVPAAAAAVTRRALLRPMVPVVAVGAAASLTLLLVRPLLPIALGDPAPNAAPLVMLAAAMTAAAALATALAMAVARRVRRPWLPTLASAVALAAVITLWRPEATLLAAGVLAAVTVALAATMAALVAPVARAVAPGSPPPAGR